MILIFAVVVFALAYYASQDIHKISKHYLALAPLQKAIEKNGVKQITKKEWQQQYLPPHLYDEVTINPDSIIALEFNSLSGIPKRFNHATLIITPLNKGGTQIWRWQCQYQGHPEWQAYLPLTCDNATKFKK